MHQKSPQVSKGARVAYHQSRSVRVSLTQVLEAFNTLVSNTQVALGQVKGVTCLPLPSESRVYAEDEVVCIRPLMSLCFEIY